MAKLYADERLIKRTDPTSGEVIRDEEAEAEALGVFETNTEMALWETFGSRADTLAAPAWLVNRIRLFLIGRAEGQQRLNERTRRESENAANGASGHSNVTTSRSASPRRD